MSEIATARINSFGPSPKADVTPEEFIFVLTSSQLRQIITEALQPLQDEVLQLRATVARQDKKIASLESTQDTLGENQLIQLQLIHKLREADKKEPGKTEASRAERIEKYLASRPDHRATFETLKGMLQVDNVRLNEAIKVLIATSDRSFSIQKERTGDKRKRSLIMLPK